MPVAGEAGSGTSVSGVRVGADLNELADELPVGLRPSVVREVLDRDCRSAPGRRRSSWRDSKACSPANAGTARDTTNSAITANIIT